MVKFVVEIKLDNLEQTNSKEYENKFDEHVYQYSNRSFERNDNVTKIIFDSEEWNKIKMVLPGKLHEIDEEIFIKDDMLRVTNSADIGNNSSSFTKEYFEDTCIKILNNQNKICLLPMKNYIDESIVKFMKNRIGSISPRDFEFFDKKSKLYHSYGQRGVKISKICSASDL